MNVTDTECPSCERPSHELVFVAKATGDRESQCLIVGLCAECSGRIFSSEMFGSERVALWRAIGERVRVVPERFQVFKGPHTEVIRQYHQRGSQMLKIDPSNIKAELKLEIELVKGRLESSSIGQFEGGRFIREAKDAMEAESSLATWRKQYRDEKSRFQKAQKEVNVLENLVKSLEAELADLREREALARKARVGQIIADRLEGRSGLPASKLDREIDDLAASLEEARERRDRALADLEQRRGAVKEARLNALKARADLAHGVLIYLSQEMRRYAAERHIALRLTGENGYPREITVAVRGESIDFAVNRLRGELVDLEVDEALAAWQGD